MSCVLDCSIAMAWCFSDETNAYCEGVLDWLGQRSAVVPAIWPLEVTNVLLVAERRKRLTESQSIHFVELLKALPIVVDEATADHAMATTFSLARAHHLSSYDAAYLELALRMGLPLATRDIKLSKAGKSCGAALLTSAHLKG